jgi:prepilin-type N-terminal cleavage/methylation domain-containing protein
VIRRYAGFTLIEMLLVVAIIGVLVTLLFSGVQIALKASRSATAGLEVRQIAQAITTLIGDHGGLGDLRDATASDFVLRPMYYLMVRPRTLGDPVYLDPKVAQLMRGSAIYTSATRENAEHMRDPFGAPYEIAVTASQLRASSGVTTYDRIDRITIRSTAGTPAVADDIVLRYEATTGQWAEPVDKARN